MKKKLIYMGEILNLLLSLSCSLNEVKAPSSYEDGTWKGLFEGFWNGMNQNYLFWDLDSPSGEWDAVYDEYIGKFEALGNIAGTTEVQSKVAFGYFYEATKNLSDSHYSFSLTIPPESGDEDYSYYFRPSEYRMAKRLFLGFREDKIKYLASKGFALSMLIGFSSIDSYNSIANKTFGLDVFLADASKARLTTSESVPQPADKGKLDEFFSSWSILSLKGRGGALFALAGITKEDVGNGIPGNCLYLLFDNFLFLSVVTQDLGFEEADSIASQSFLDILTAYESRDDLSGMVVDLRGNSGGDMPSTGLLFSQMLSSDRILVYQKSKVGDGRLDYSGLYPTIVRAPSEPTALALAEKPIAILVNEGTVSMGEIAAFFLRSFPKAIMLGTTTKGAFGGWSDDSAIPEGGFKIGSYMKITAPYQQVIMPDGKNYEGIGLTPDTILQIDSAQFEEGDDTRLKAGFAFVRDNQ